MHIFSFFSFFFLVIFWIISHVPFHPILALQVYVLFLFSPCYLHTNYQSLKLIIILPSGKRPGPVQLRLRPPVPSARTVAPLLVLCPCGPRWSAFHSQCRSNPYFCFPLWPPFLLASPFHLRLNSSCSTSFGISCWGGVSGWQTLSFCSSETSSCRPCSEGHLLGEGLTGVFSRDWETALSLSRGQLPGTLLSACLPLGPSLTLCRFHHNVS